MITLNRIVVGLDLTDVDKKIIQYVAELAQQFKQPKIYFLHVIQAYDLPDKASKSYPDLETSLTQLIRDELHTAIRPELIGQEYEIVIRVDEENAAKVVMEFVKTHNIDLTVLGEKAGQDRTSYYGRKIAREVQSDVIFVPEYAEVRFDTIMYATDFSRESERAFHLARHLAASAGMQFYYLHDTTSAYFPMGTVPTTQRRVRRRIEKKKAQFGKRLKINKEYIEPVVYEHGNLENPASTMLKTAADKQSDLIVVGAKGFPGNVTTLLGNISENLRVMEKEIPVWITKNQSQYLGFWDKLMG